MSRCLVLFFIDDFQSAQGHIYKQVELREEVKVECQLFTENKFIELFNASKQRRKVKATYTLSPTSLSLLQSLISLLIHRPLNQSLTPLCPTHILLLLININSQHNRNINRIIIIESIKSCYIFRVIINFTPQPFPPSILFHFLLPWYKLLSIPEHLATVVGDQQNFCEVLIDTI